MSDILAQHAAFAVAPASGAMLASVKDDAQVEFIPLGRWEEAFEVALGLFDVFSGCEFPTFGEAVDVGIDGKGSYTERLGHDDRGGFVADAGQRFERGEIRRDRAAVGFDEDTGKLGNGGGFAWGESTRANDFSDLFDRHPHHGFGGGGEVEKGGRHRVDASVGALRGKQNRDEERVGIAVIERNWSFRIKLRQSSRNVIGPFLFPHGGDYSCFGADAQFAFYRERKVGSGVAL